MTKNMNPNLAPFFNHAEESVNAAFKAHRGKSEADVLEAHAKLNADLDVIKEEAGENFDLMKVKDKLGSDNAATRAEKLTEMNGELIGIENVLREIDAQKNANNEREKHGYVTGARNEEVFEEVPVSGNSNEISGKEIWTELKSKVPASSDIVMASQAGIIAKFDTSRFKALVASDFPAEILRDGTIDYRPLRPLSVFDIMPKRVISQNSFKYMEQTVHTPSAKVTKEGAASTAATYTFVERERPLVKVTSHFKVTEELLRDSMEMEDISRDLMRYDIQAIAETQLINGSGAGDPRQANGFIQETNRQTQNVTVKAAGIDSAAIDDLYDARLAVRIGGRSFPNALIVHPNFWTALEKIKLDGVGYVLSNPAAATAPSFRGMLIVENESAPFDYGTADDVLGCIVDMTKLTAVISSNVEYVVGLDGNDLTQGMRTIRGVIYCNVRNRRPQAVVRLVQKAT